MSAMLTQTEADRLIAMAKLLEDPPAAILFPQPGEKLELGLVSTDRRERLIADVNRGRIRLTKCTFQERDPRVTVLLRLDLDGPPHENPDGTVLPCPHLHMYREGWWDKWAIPAPPALCSTSNLTDVFREFLVYCNVQAVPPVQRALI